MLWQTVTQPLRTKRNTPYQFSKCIPTDGLQFMLAAEQDDEGRTGSSKTDKADSKPAGWSISLQRITSNEVYLLWKAKLLLRKDKERTWAVLLS